MVAGLIVIWLCIFWPTLGKLPLIRPEAMYAQIPLEMLQSGDWLTPRLNGARYLDKPPLLYWMNLIAFKVGGISGESVRWTTFLIGLGEVLATFVIGALLFSRLTGWLSAIVLISSIGFFAMHQQILPDHLITLTLICSIIFLWCWRSQPRWYYSLGFYFCCALGLLSKGFIGLFFPLAIGVTFALITRQRRFWRFFFHPGALLGFIALTVPWFWLMELRHPGFLNFHLVNEQIMRFLGKRSPADVQSLPLVGFWLFSFIWLMPWTPFLPTACIAIWPKNFMSPSPEEEGRILLVLWALVVLLFFSLSSTRIEYYTLPALPALALIIGWRLELYLKEPHTRAIKLSILLYAFLIIGMIALLPVLESICVNNRREFIGMFGQLQPLAHRSALVFAVLLVATTITCWRGVPQFCLFSLFGAALVLLFFTFQSLRVLSPHLSDAWVGDFLRDQVQPGDAVVMGNIEEFEYGMSLRFYTQRRVLMVQRGELPAFGFPLKPSENFLITTDTLLELWKGPQRVFLLVDDCSPENYLPNTTVLQARGGKRLIVNHAYQRAQYLPPSPDPLYLKMELPPQEKNANRSYDTFTR